MNFLKWPDLSYTTTGIGFADRGKVIKGSNHLKYKARIGDGARTRVESDQAELLLKLYI